MLRTPLGRVELASEKWSYIKKTVWPRIRIGGNNLGSVWADAERLNYCKWRSHNESITPDTIVFLDHLSLQRIRGRSLLFIKALWKVRARSMPHRPLMAFKLHLENSTLNCLPFWVAAAKKSLSWGFFRGTFMRSSGCLSAYQLGEEQRQMWYMRWP